MNRETEWKREYREEVFSQTHPYLMWQKKWEEDLPKGKDEVCHVIYREDFMEKDSVHPGKLENCLNYAGEKARYVLMVSRDGELADFAKAVVCKYLETHPISLAYGDEDEMEKGQKRSRRHPWFKPDWSPDTLKSMAYFGNAVVGTLPFFREKAQLLWKNEQLESLNYREFLQFLAEKEKQVGHIPQILFHAYHPYKEEPVCGIPKRESIPKVSVVIPSKDHPQLLEQCVSSLKEKTSYPDYEIIVVDNGSNEENKEKIIKLQKQIPFTYLYREMDFNFARMCNLGAKEAKGEVLIFLNDDITVNSFDWMKIMALQATEENTGAVGAKLYYPEGNKIQHAGITNMTVGPVHKMGGLTDEESIYHGRNQGVWNVLAVTAACMAIAKPTFDFVGGFCEEFKVAYNDVDLCFSLWEKGFYNVQRNDAVLYHHESLSRGSDDTPQKAERLKKEWERLYEKHPALYGKDPFYSPHLVQERLDGEYHVEYSYPHEDAGVQSKLWKTKAYQENLSHKFRKMLHRKPKMLFHLDRIMEVSGKKAKEEEAYFYLEGWLGATDKPLYRYERTLLLKNQEGECYEAEVFPKYREDTKGVLPGEDCYELSGITAKIPRSALAPGEYKIGYCIIDKKNKKRYVMYDREKSLICQM